MLKLLGSPKSKITKDVNGEDVKIRPLWFCQQWLLAKFKSLVYT